MSHYINKKKERGQLNLQTYLENRDLFKFLCRVDDINTYCSWIKSNSWSYILSNSIVEIIKDGLGISKNALSIHLFFSFLRHFLLHHFNTSKSGFLRYFYEMRYILLIPFKKRSLLVYYKRFLFLNLKIDFIIHFL